MAGIFFALSSKVHEKKVISSINEMNKILNTSFSYYEVAEEVDLLKAIPLSKINPYEKRYSHFNNVSYLWLKGLKEEFAFKNSNIANPSKENVDDIYDKFKNELIRYLIFIKVFSSNNYNGGKENIKDTRYLKKFNTYNKSDFEGFYLDLAFSRTLLNHFEKNLEQNSKMVEINKTKNINKDNFQDYVIGFFNKEHKGKAKMLDNIIYFGPVTFNNDIKLINDLSNKAFIKRYNEGKINSYTDQDINHFKKAIDNRLNQYKNDFHNYRKDQIQIERNRIDNMEKHLRLNNDDVKDFYFDSFLWRLLNDLSYISEYFSGGVKKVLDYIEEISNKDIKIASPSSKELEILLDIDSDDLNKVNERAKNNKGNNSSGGTTKKMDKLIREQNIVIHELNKTEEAVREANKVEPTLENNIPTLKR